MNSTSTVSVYDYLLKTAAAIGDRVVNDRLDYQQQKRLLQLEAQRQAATAPVATPSPSKGLPKWVLPSAFVGALILLLIVRRKSK